MMNNKKIRKVIQCVSLGFFLYLLWISVFPLAEYFLPVEFFLRLDPLVSLLVPLAVRDFVPTLGLGLLALVLAIFVGRVFCGFICPMGISLDVSRSIFAEKQITNKTLPSTFGHSKYFILTIIAVSALFGISYIFWASPISLITRFYALLVHPIIILLGDNSLGLARPIFESMGSHYFAYLQIPPRSFNAVYFIALFFVLLFVLERVRPRFWCRYLCPAGAVLGLLSWRPLWRRRVHTCIACGKCMRACPTSAICAEPTKTKYAECITCRTCADVCPVRGIYFLPDFKKRIKNDQKAVQEAKPKQGGAQKTCKVPQKKSDFLPSRRSFICAAGAGAGLAGLGYINTASPFALGAKANFENATCIRPPGARPEMDFLSRCIRCGQCMKVCPTNGLQPIWLGSGFEGIFSPVLMSRRGPCEPECAACGQVCPTEAINPLPLQEKQQAKIGTAVVKPGLCLAWAEGRSCVVCQEVCPFGAISLEENEASNVPVPIVNAKRCFGCGFCERHCPVHVPAIIIYPLNALRLEDGNYIEAAKDAGLDIKPVALRSNAHGLDDDVPEGTLPPGFTE